MAVIQANVEPYQPDAKLSLCMLENMPVLYSEDVLPQYFGSMPHKHSVASAAARRVELEVLEVKGHLEDPSEVWAVQALLAAVFGNIVEDRL